MGKKSRRKKDQRSRTTSTLGQHQRSGSKLVPPLMTLPEMRPVSWSDDQIPEMLWAALLVADLGRVRALDRFRDVAALYDRESINFGVADASHSEIAKLDPASLRNLLGVVTKGPRYSAALAPLLLLDDLPARDAWAEALAHPDNDPTWESLMDAVAKVFDHQSQEATDCRWLRLLVRLVAGQIHGVPKEQIEEIFEYPSKGDMRHVRPMIRAMEMGLREVVTGQPATEWAHQFWAEGYRKTACFGFTDPPVADRHGISLPLIERLYSAVAQHAAESRTTTAPDHRHDIVFGTTLYGLTVLHEIVEGLIDGGILGHVGIRVLAECSINLSYLLMKDDPDLWTSYRAYGAGQAKLSFLKFEDVTSPPHSIDIEVLRRVANEDLWQEFLPIELGHWEKSNLRKISEECALKESIYDPYYQWPSQFAHGHWGAIRDTVFMNCANPLHRFHRVPRPAPRQLPPTLEEAIALVNRLLDLVDRAYPGLNVRIVEASKSSDK